MDKAKPRFPIIIIDDDRVLGTTVAQVLKSMDWKTEFRDGGEAGLDWVSQHMPCIVLSDYDMPGMDGLQVLKNLDLQRTGFMVFSGIDDEEVVAEALRMRADDFAFKPISDWEKLNQKLLKVQDKLQLRLDIEKQRDEMAQKADWYYWKGLFLSGSNDSEVEQVLEMLHVQLNQDTNYTMLMKKLGDLDAEPTELTLSPATVGMLRAGIGPIARLAAGIGIAKRVVNSVPTFKSMSLRDFKRWIEEQHARWLKEIAGVRGHRLDIKIGNGLRPDNVYIHVDEDMLTEILAEVVTNACKYSNPDDLVSIHVSAETENLLFMVTNPAHLTTRKHDGTMLEGIPREIEPLLFKYFVRYSINTQNQYPEKWPMGLGLPLVKKVTEKHAGTVSIHNETWFIDPDGRPCEAKNMVVCRIELPLKKEAILEEKTDEADPFADMGMGDFELL